MKYTHEEMVNHQYYKLMLDSSALFREYYYYNIKSNFKDKDLDLKKFGLYDLIDLLQRCQLSGYKMSFNDLLVAYFDKYEDSIKTLIVKFQQFNMSKL